MRLLFNGKIFNRHKKSISVIAGIITILGLSASGFISTRSEARPSFFIAPETMDSISYKDSISSLVAFEKVYRVLMSPRCMNCHPAGDIPLQGDDSHLHTMSPVRGKDGKGLYAMKCSNCHQPTNTAGFNTPPGNPKWALPPADMKMVFEGKSARELAQQIMDYKRNGHKNKAQLIEHARDTLVKAGWAMGEGRKPPPVPYEEFVQAWDEWINKGGVVPKN